MDFLRRTVDERQECFERYLRVTEYLRRDAVHQVGEVIGKHARHVQPLAVVLGCFVDTARERLRQGVDGGDVVDVMPRDETRDAAPVIDHHIAAEGLEEIHNT